MRLRERNADEKHDGPEIVESEMHRGQLVPGQRRKGAVEQPEQHHRRPADEIDMSMQMRLIKALVDATQMQADQNEPAVDVFHGILSLSFGFETD